MKFLGKLLAHLFAIGFLTLISQVGGIVYLLAIPVSRLVIRAMKIKGKFNLLLAKLLGFILLYVLMSFTLLPILAKSLSNRVPMPIFGETVKPLNMGYCLLNRHYVKPELRQLVLDVGEKVEAKHPGSILAYLDASFPFKNGFPLIPHLSHHDGRKIDMAFFYINAANQKEVNRKTPTVLGYGSSLPVKSGEVNQADICAQRGHWQYSLMEKFFPKVPWRTYGFDLERNKTMVRLFAKEKRVGKIFIEPHVKSRLGLGRYQKLRFAGCHAVRHDDHLHIQL